MTGSRPAGAIVDVAEAERADVIMMATHGRGGLDRLWMGSVTERVVHYTQLPVFLLPVRNGVKSDQSLVVEETSAAATTSETR